MVPTFFDQNMPRNLGFYDRKMNWTFLLIFSSSSLKNWTKFSSSSFSKKVNWVQFKVHQKSELLNWTELFRSVQSLPWLVLLTRLHKIVCITNGLIMKYVLYCYNWALFSSFVHTYGGTLLCIACILFSSFLPYSLEHMQCMGLSFFLNCLKVKVDQFTWKESGKYFCTKLVFRFVQNLYVT